MDREKISSYPVVNRKEEIKTKKSICTTEIKHFIKVEDRRRSFNRIQNKEEEPTLSLRHNTRAAYKFIRNNQNCKEKKFQTSKSSENILKESANENLIDEKQDTKLHNSLFQSHYWLEPRAVPCGYSTTLYIDLDTKIKRYVEETRLEMRLMPCPFIQSTGNMKHYKSTVVTDIQAPVLTPIQQT